MSSIALRTAAALAGLFVLALLCAQDAPPRGIVDVAGAITATAGTLQCTANQTVGQATSVLIVRCVDADTALHDSAYVVPKDGAATYSLARNGNTITWTLMHGTPDQWRISANDVARTGSF